MTLCQSASGPNVLKDRSPFSFKDKAGQEKQLFFPDCLTVDGEGSTLPWNLENKTPNDTVRHHGRPETSLSLSLTHTHTHTHITSHSFWHYTYEMFQWLMQTVNSLTCHSTASCPCPGSADRCAEYYRCDHQTQKPATHHTFGSCYIIITASTWTSQTETSHFQTNVLHSQHHHNIKSPWYLASCHALMIIFTSLTQSLTHSLT